MEASVDSRLARIKAEARRRREDRETEERMRVMEKKRREDLLRRQFNEWNIAYYPNGRVELALVIKISTAKNYNNNSSIKS